MTAVDAGTATRLVDRLGGESAGAYLDTDGRMVVTVTTTAAATVRAAGAVPRLVKHSAAALASATAVLDRSPRIPGTAWAVDPVGNQVVGAGRPGPHPHPVAGHAAPG